MKRLFFAALCTLALLAPAHAQQGAPIVAPSKGGTMVINLLGPITSESMADLVRSAQDAVLTGLDEVQIRISSVGGKVYAARFAVNALAALPIKVTTVAMSDVSSSAVAIFCAGEERYVAPGATIYLHQLTRFAERSAKTAAAQQREDEIVLGWYDGMLEKCLADSSDMNRLMGYLDRDLILDAEEIASLGMANAAFETLRAKPYFGRAVNIVPRVGGGGSDGWR
jgi:ATP-dependent protease ClpP protease subunit